MDRWDFQSPEKDSLIHSGDWELEVISLVSDDLDLGRGKGAGGLTQKVDFYSTLSPLPPSPSYTALGLVLFWFSFFHQQIRFLS